MADERTEIQAADPRVRRRVLILLAVATLVGLLGIVEIEEWLHRLRQDAAANPGDAVEDAARLLRLMAAAISFSLAGLGLVIARFSWRVLCAERLPPPASPVIVDTRVVVGAAARRRAYVGFALAASLGAFAVILPYLLWRTLYLWSSGPGPV